MKPHEASDYSQWLLTNYLAAPMLMFAGTMLVISIGVLVLSNKRSLNWHQSGITSRLIAIFLLDVAAVLAVWHVLEKASLPHLLSAWNVVFICSLPLFTCFLLATITRKHIQLSEGCFNK